MRAIAIWGTFDRKLERALESIKIKSKHLQAIVPKSVGGSMSLPCQSEFKLMAERTYDGIIG